MVWIASNKFKVTHYLKKTLNQTHILLGLTKKSQNMNLTIYLKTIGRNVDPRPMIIFPKSDLSLDG
jgi:hypothetical protein